MTSVAPAGATGLTRRVGRTGRACCGIAGVANRAKALAGREANLAAGFMRDSESLCG